MRQPLSLNRNLVVLVGLNLIVLAAWAQEQRFQVDPVSPLTSSVKFTSDAPLELINGQTKAVTGKIKYDSTYKFDRRHPFSVAFDVDLNSIDTGIPLRNEHMRDQYLETKQYPKATFKASELHLTEKPPFKPGQIINLTATGPFTLHGKSVLKTIPLKITYMPLTNKKAEKSKRAQIRIQGHFPVKLDEHGIKRPEMVFQKLADTVYITLDLMAESPEVTAASLKK